MTSEVAFYGRTNNSIHRERGSVYYTVAATSTPSSFQIQQGSVYSSRLNTIFAIYELCRCTSFKIQFTTSTSVDAILSYTPYFDFTPPNSFTQMSEQPNVAMCFNGVGIPGMLSIGRRELRCNPYNWYHTRQLAASDLTVQGLLFYCSSANTTIKMRIDYVFEFTAPVYSGTESKSPSLELDGDSKDSSAFVSVRK